MTFGMTLGEHLTIAASASMFYIAINYKNKENMKVAASNINIKIHEVFFNTDSWCPRDHCTVENPSGLDTSLLLKNV